MTDLFDFKPKPSAFAVMGNPVAHSKSPQIHQMFAQQSGIDLTYDRIHVDVGGFEQAVSHFCAHGGAGLNITVPYKIEAWHLCQHTHNSLSSRAKLAEAVNTIRVEKSGALFGDNTDGIGLISDIQRNLSFSISGKAVLVIGAGGAVRGILSPLLECNPASVTIANRTVGKASQLVDVFSRIFNSDNTALQSATIDQSGTRNYDLIINGTASSLNQTLPGISESCIHSNTLVYDMMYSSQPTIFMQWALSHGARQAHDGLGMLVQQAAASFEIWHQYQPETMPVINAIRKS